MNSAGEARRRRDPLPQPPCRREASRQRRSARAEGELRRHVGMVFQHFNLFPHMSVLENVIEGPVIVQRKSRAEAVEIAMDYIAKVGLAEKRDARPDQPLRRPEAACRHRPGARHCSPTRFAARRGHQRALRVQSSSAGSARRGARSRQSGHDHGHRHPRDLLRRGRLRSGRIHGEWPRRRCQGLPETILRRPDNERLKAFLARFHG